MQPMDTAPTPSPQVPAMQDSVVANEYVLRESATGNTILSLIDDGKLLRLVCAQKNNDEVVVEDRFMTKKTAFTGFTHYRYDWLDSGKYAWWVITTIGAISLIFIPGGGSFLFLIGALLSLAQLFDPELLFFETNAGRHRLLLYRYGSNRELMNFSMDEIDSTMQQMLSGGQLDGSGVETKAAEIEENRAAEIRAAQEAAEAATELAKATAQPVVLPTPQPQTVHDTQPAEVTENQPEPPSIPAVVPEEESLEEQVVESKEIVEEPKVVIPPAPAPPPTPMEVPAASPAPPAPPVPQAQALPPPPLPAPAPPVPQAQPLPPPPAPAPPPQVVQPPAMEEMPPPPPPVGAGQMAPDPFAPQVAKEPSTFEVKAAPREDLISTDEAIDLLNDLSE